MEDVLRWGWVATAASDAVWDDEGKYAIATRHVQLVRDAGVLAELPIHLAALSLAKGVDRRLRGCGFADRGERKRGGGDRKPDRALRLAKAPRTAGREAEASAVIASAIEQDAAGGQGLAAA